VHRFFVPRNQFDEAAPALTGDEAHHAARVRRVKLGETVGVFDGQGAEWICAVEAVEKNRVRLRLIERRAVPSVRVKIILAQSLLPNRAMEFVIEKATELGASAILPIAPQRSVATVKKSETAAKLKRWRDLSIESSKQCGATWLPAIGAPCPFDEFLRSAAAELKLIAALDKRALQPRQVLESFAKERGHSPVSVVVAIGPEGDFTTDELDAALRTGFIPITLGAHTLRSETAAVVALSVLNYELQL
jgi:16S rRNA (uracil1498-N3)-methyltransferase